MVEVGVEVEVVVDVEVEVEVVVGVEVGVVVVVVVVVEVVVEVVKRSSKQNNAYWGLICTDHAAPFYTEHNELFIKDMLKAFGADVPDNEQGRIYLDYIGKLSQLIRIKVTKDMAHTLFKFLFNGGKSTQFIDDNSEKGTKKMIEYETKIRAHLAGYECDVPEAGEIPLPEFIQ